MDMHRTKAQLINELETLRARVKYLESSQGIVPQTGDYNLSVAENAPVGIALFRKGITLYVNQTYSRMSGCEVATTLIGTPFTDLVAPQCRQELVDRNRRRELGENVTDSYETICLRKDGTEFPVHIQAAYIELPDGPATIAFFTDIAERKQAEEALHEKTEELDRFFSLALDLLCIADVDGYFIRLNTSWQSTLGYELNDLENRQFLELVHPDDRENTLAAIAALAAGQQVVDFANRFRCKDGSYRWLEWRSVPYQNRLIYAAARDITSRKQAEVALRESEEKFRHVVEASPMGIHMYHLEPDNRLVFIGANSAADHILRVENSQFIGKTIEEAFPPLAETEVPGRYRLTAAQGEAWHTSQIDYEEGRISGAFDVYTFQTSPGYMAAMFVDITERKRTDVALQQNTARLKILHEIDQAILQARTPQAIAVVALEHLRELIPCLRASISVFDLEADVVEVLAAHVSGLTQVGTGLKMPVHQFGIDEEVLRGRIAFVNDLASQPSLSGVRQMLQKEGVRSIINVPLLVQGKPIGALNVGAAEPDSFNTDHIQIVREVADQLAISIQHARLRERDQRHAEELEMRVAERTVELQDAYEQLQALSHVKDVFVSNVSHELRTPIASAKAYLYLLVARPDKQQQYIETLNREVSRLEHLIEGLLTLSRLDQNRVSLDLTDVNLNRLIGEYVADRALLAENKNLTLIFTPAAELPAVTADCLLIGDVLSILLTNSFNYTPSGGQVTISTQMRGPEGGTQVGFSVSDSGIGISPDELPHLFDRFYRGKAARETQVSGTGLGLSIAKEIVDLHHGLIEAHSDGISGHGTRFTIWLPTKLPT